MLGIVPTVNNIMVKLRDKGHFWDNNYKITFFVFCRVVLFSEVQNV